MLDMILSKVLLPEPLRPTMPKNSPCLTSKDTPPSASRLRKLVRRKGWRASSLSAEILWSGMLNDFLTSWTETTTGASGEILLGFASVTSAPVQQIQNLVHGFCVEGFVPATTPLYGRSCCPGIAIITQADRTAQCLDEGTDVRGDGIDIR